MIALASVNVNTLFLHSALLKYFIINIEYLFSFIFLIDYLFSRTQKKANLYFKIHLLLFWINFSSQAGIFSHIFERNCLLFITLFYLLYYDFSSTDCISFIIIFYFSVVVEIYFSVL